MHRRAGRGLAVGVRRTAPPVRVGWHSFPVEEATTTADGERDHSGIEWLELFFDLMGAAAVAVFVDGLLTGADLANLGIFLVLFSTGWFAWTLVVMYADLAAERTATRTIVAAMVLLGVMAATSPLHFTARANAFAIAFIALRLMIAAGARNTGRRLVNDPMLLQAGSVTTPWIVSLWVATPGKYWLWGLGVLVDMGVLAVRTGRRRRHPRANDRRLRRRLRAWADNEAVTVDAEHLGERLGLVWLILLGTIASTLVLDAARSDWDLPYVATVLAGFAILLLMFFLGFSGPPALRPHNALGRRSPRIGLSIHLWTMLSIAFAAVGIGASIAEPLAPVPLLLRVLLGLGLSGYLLAVATARATDGAPARPLWPVSGVAAAACLATAALPVPGVAALGIGTLALAVALVSVPR